MTEKDREPRDKKSLDEEAAIIVFRSILEQWLTFEREATEKQQRENRRKLTKVIILGVLLFLIYNLPILFGKRMTCEEYKTAPFYKTVHYHIHPLIVDPCDTTSPMHPHHKAKAKNGQAENL